MIIFRIIFQVISGEVSNGQQEKNFHRNGCQALEQVGVAESLGLKVFVRCVDVAFRHVIWWWNSQH